MKEKLKKLPQEVMDAQYRLNSAVIRELPKEEIDRLRGELLMVTAKYGKKNKPTNTLEGWAKIIVKE